MPIYFNLLLISSNIPLISSTNIKLKFDISKYSKELQLQNIQSISSVKLVSKFDKLRDVKLLQP